MKTYLVGGAVRDKLLGIEPEELDWVVVGATPEEMLAEGFRPVGKDFPVFLHPQTNEEFALARTERKTAPGYHGFTFHAAADVTLEEDLRRRDLTINAMAMTQEGKLIDPFGGEDDLEEGILRHVSPAFREDPVRILRVARFAARFAQWGFRVSHGTHTLMKKMVEAGEVDALVPERVWKETRRALAESSPRRFFEVLDRCGALEKLFPELAQLFGVPQPERFHPEIDTGEHVLMVLDAAARLSDDPRVRFAALVHDLGKGETPRHLWPRHIGHEARGVPLVRQLCERLRLPRDYCDLARLVAAHHGRFRRIGTELEPSEVVGTLEAVDAFRRPQRFEQFLLACEADLRGRRGLAEQEYPQGAVFRRALQAASAVDVRPLLERGFRGEALGDELRRQRVIAVEGAVGHGRKDGSVTHQQAAGNTDG